MDAFDGVILGPYVIENGCCKSCECRFSEIFNQFCWEIIRGGCFTRRKFARGKYNNFGRNRSRQWASWIIGCNKGREQYSWSSRVKKGGEVLPQVLELGFGLRCGIGLLLTSLSLKDDVCLGFCCSCLAN